jgi:type I restriction enzyme S subunit
MTTMCDGGWDGPPLPEGWVWTTLGEICQVNPRMAFPEQFTDETPVNFVPMAAVDDVKGAIVAPEVRPIGEIWKGYKRFAESDVIFAKITPCMENGKAAIASNLVNDIGLGSTEFHVLRPSNAVLPHWIYHFVRQSSFRGDAAAKMTGTAGQLRVPTLFMEEASIPLAPLPEQRRIVAEIETQFTRLDAAVAALERVQTALGRYRASVLKAACEGRLVPTETELARAEGREYEPADALLARILAERRARWEAEQWEKEVERAKKKAAQVRPTGAGRPGRISHRADEEWLDLAEAEYSEYLPKDDRWKQKYEEPEPSDREDLPELPAGWVWATMEQLGEVIGGLTKNSKRKTYPLKLPYLRVANVYADELRLDDVQEIGIRETELERVLLQKGDLLVVEGNGSIDQIGRVAIWNGSIEPCVHQNHIIKVRFELPEVNNYILSWLLSLRGREQIVRVASSTSGLYTLNLSKVSMLPIPLSPLAEQRRIVEEVERRLSVVEALEAAVATNLRRAERLRQAVLKRAFEGRLVPQDPGDEPASALLARVKAGREGRAGGKGKHQARQMRLPLS